MLSSPFDQFSSDFRGIQSHPWCLYNDSQGNQNCRCRLCIFSMSILEHKKTTLLQIRLIVPSIYHSISRIWPQQQFKVYYRTNRKMLPKFVFSNWYAKHPHAHILFGFVQSRVKSMLRNLNYMSSMILSVHKKGDTGEHCHPWTSLPWFSGYSETTKSLFQLEQRNIKQLAFANFLFV